MTKIPGIKTLESIAVRIRDLAILRAPKDTGNLKRTIKQANTPAKSKMIKTSSDLKEITISLDYAPTGAQYGQYWNDPYGKGNGRTSKLKKRYPQHFNYAISAINDKQLSKEFDVYLDSLGDYIVEEIQIELNK